MTHLREHRSDAWKCRFDAVPVRNTRGDLRVWVRVTDHVHRGVVVLPGKWWGFPEETGALANLLTPSAWTPGGQPAYNDTFVEVVGEQ